MDVFKWFNNLWNLRLIFDRYLPKINRLVEAIDLLQLKYDDLRQAKIDMEKKIAELKASLKASTGILVPEEKPQRVTVHKYYDAQMNVEHVDVEINGEDVSPDEDTVKE